jgi:cytochrome c553
MKHLLLGMIFSVALVGCSEKEQPAAPKTTPPKSVAADIVAGKTIAEKDCKGCHGLDGKGAAPAIPDLAAQRERYLLAAMQEYRDGKRTHAALRDLAVHMSEADERNVVAYYASLPAITNASGEQAKVEFPYERGKALAAACTKCHGENGNSNTPGTPSLAGQQPLYFVAAIQEYLHAKRDMAPMHSELRTLNKFDMESLALYFASQTPAQRPAPAVGNPTAGEPLTAVCGGCHGAHGVSTDAATPSLASQDPQYLVAGIKGYRTSRKHEIMERQVASLSDGDIENIAAFYAIQKSQAAEKGENFVRDLAAKCDRCHGSDVDNPAMAVPKINGQDREYLVMALRAYRDDRRESSMMHRMSLPYSDSIIESMASLYASRPAQ